jgi:DNA ligase-1
MSAVQAMDIKELANVENYASMPTLYGVKSNGGIKQWTVGYIVNDDGTAILRKRHGTVGGKLVTSDKKCTAKFVGKANERNAAEQARFEMNAAHKKQLDVGMQLSIEAAKAYDPMLPMLVKTFKNDKKHIKFPCYVQPKLNGVRCLANMVNGSKPEYISRKNKRYETLDHLTEPLMALAMTDVAWDGEIYNHGWNFAKILQRVKKLRPDSNQLQYWIYDVIEENALDFQDRNTLIKVVLGPKGKRNGPLIIVPTIKVNSEDEIRKIHDEWVKLGFEGAIVRNAKGKYKKGLVRSYDIQRFKDFHDAEFKIIGGKAEEVQLEDESWVNCIVFECETEDGKTFFVRPKGDVASRARMFDDLDKLIGKDLTVRYGEKSEDNIPIFPVGIAIRDYE